MITCLTQAALKELLSYDEATGDFRWRISVARVKTGDIAGGLNREGYHQIGVGMRRYLTHRLVWLYVFGVWPKEFIDHINGVRHDNRLSNLRECSRAENAQNHGAHKDNTSGFVGVSFYKRAKTWRASIRTSDGLKHLGCFTNPEVAHMAYVDAKRKYHSFSPEQR
jgi:hypothetical protein